MGFSAEGSDPVLFMDQFADQIAKVNLTGKVEGF